MKQNNEIKKIKSNNIIFTNTFPSKRAMIIKIHNKNYHYHIFYNNKLYKIME